MELRGRKLVQYGYGNTEHWLRVKHVDLQTLTYDSFMGAPGDVIFSLRQDVTCALSDILSKLRSGELTIE